MLSAEPSTPALEGDQTEPGHASRDEPVPVPVGPSPDPSESGTSNGAGADADDVGEYEPL
ncbi:hypothetical protein ACWDYK_08240 [Streptomyces anthocyanicus]|uniref:hypothetical protein n=1 Tax=Streptomyces anthocyanicus TaxID=68174 RepID=UPI003251B8CD